MNWKTIDTAPDNSDKSDYFFCMVAWGPEGDQSTGHGMRYKGEWFVGALFYRGGRVDQRQYEYKEIKISPTHWMDGPDVPIDC